MTNTQTLEILKDLKTLPSDKVIEAKDFIAFLRERYGKSEIIDESDEWTDEDLQEISNTSNSSEKKSPAELLAKLAALPIEGKTDKFSGRDHDKILYGEDRKR